VVEQHNLLFTASTTQSGLSFVCLCEKNVETRRVGQFLTNLKSRWIQTYGSASSELAEASKDSEFRAQLKDLIDHYNEICPPTTPAEEPTPPQPQQQPQSPQPLPEVAAIELRDTDPETFREDGSLAGLRMKIWWQRYRCKVFFVIGLIVWLYVLFAWYCGDPTLAKCF
jgi:hypothetical protein